MNSKRLTLERNEIAHNRGVTGHRPDAEGLRRIDVSGEPDHRQRARAAARRIVREPVREQPFRANDMAVRAVLQRRAQHVLGERIRAELERSRPERARQHERAGASRRVGNRWSRYSGFDFDGDGIGESAHPLLGPFERIEGANGSRASTCRARPLARWSWPLAACLPQRGASSDAHPLTGAPRRRGKGPRMARGRRTPALSTSCGPRGACARR